MGHDRPQLDLNSDEELWHSTMLGLSTNEHGERTLAGLTVEESIELNEFQRHFFGRRKKHSSREERNRYRELTEKFEASRRKALVAAELRRHGAVLSDEDRDAQQKEAALKVVRLAMELTTALQAAHDAGVPMVIEQDEFSVSGRPIRQVLARLLI
ncbi:hypothetical protein EOB36_32395 [Mesorhizobium sp. M6A.T.Cr.TU.017.01.1.1]|uniref:hypothetical protein n=1 Tax=Mesorhizobium sp. M6A.T.Cr.TU.017.01.1.1 TaxID=2496774 RepID=UPI000FD1EA84|nr:hypothetical protein [Mesorhizobium sp. M6A.T.Cr.TU.017.01.1.1]RUU95487.1 hypothetical protein EOB36_32395 [Mesorhizobium sp. M6A.T.Cr.TU.017.01.1.1]